MRVDVPFPSVRRALPRTLAVTMVALVVTASATAGQSCFNGDTDGAYWRTAVDTLSGVRSDMSWDSANPLGDDGIFHVVGASLTFGDRFYWGVYRGNGIYGCSNDPADWKLAVILFLDAENVCLSDSDWPQYTPSDGPVALRTQYGTCGGGNGFRWYSEGTYRWCAGLSGSQGRFYVFGFANNAGANVLHIDTHHDNLERLLGGTWLNWANGVECEDDGYRLRWISNSNVWAEEIP